MNKKVVVGVSGGIDSSFTCWKLKEMGYEPIGLHLSFTNKKKDFNLDFFKKHKIKIHTLNLEKKFQNCVISYFKNNLLDGKTPNPCVICNKLFKFKNLIDFADKNNIYYIASGHYANVIEKEGLYYLQKGIDEKKDQSYFLCMLNQDILKRLILPLGKYKKTEIYNHMSKTTDYWHKKPQSQDICFIDDYNIFLKNHIGEKKGDIVNLKEEKLGVHNGYWYYTIGQRKGLGLSGGPYFVIKIDKIKNKVYVSNNKEELLSDYFYVINFNLINSIDLNNKKVQVKIRYKAKMNKAILTIIDKNKIKVNLLDKASQITNGQFCVFYKEKTVLGGGIILAK